MGRAGERHVSGRNGICKVLEVRTSLVCGQRGLELSKTVREEERVVGEYYKDKREPAHTGCHGPGKVSACHSECSGDSQKGFEQGNFMI